VKVIIASIMRDAEGYLGRYVAQTSTLKHYLDERGDSLGLVVAEGDSTDNTLALLQRWERSVGGVSVLKLDHGGPKYGSVDVPARWRQIAGVYNRLFDAICEIQGMDAVLHVEADLIWDAGTMLALLDHLGDAFPVVSPMIFSKAGPFYDTYGHRAEGVRFIHDQPYHQKLADWDGGLVRIDSAGNCQAMLAEVARRCRFSEETVLLGPSIYAEGYSQWLDPGLKVIHP